MLAEIPSLGHMGGEGRGYNEMGRLILAVTIEKRKEESNFHKGFNDVGVCGGVGAV